MNTYHIIAIVAVVTIVYFVFLSIYSKKRKEKQLESFKNKILTDQQKLLLSYGAILAYHRMEKIFSLVPVEILEAYQQGLRNQWGIVDNETAAARLSGLRNLSASSEIDPILEQNSADIEKIRKKVASALKLDISVVENVKSTYAWDLGRAIPLAKWCYWSGYITEDQMWQYMESVAQIAQKKGTNWTEYTISFLLGRTISGFDLDDVSIEAEQILNGKNVSLKFTDNIDIYKTYPFK